MPEGLLMYGCVISDILKRFTPATSVIILGDVTYGACCVDDLGAASLSCDFLVHYGHSCLVPLNKTCIETLYVFVEIRVDAVHAVECFKKTVPAPARVHVMGTVQFRGAVFDARAALEAEGYEASVPQAKPLSPGEVLGCTSPKDLAEGGGEGVAQAMLFFADGRFHLEAALIANPGLPAYRYDPYGRVLTAEGYGFDKMLGLRRAAIDRARGGRTVGVVLGILGRQGNPSILRKVVDALERSGRETFVVLLSEIFPDKLDMMPQADFWVQIACPRLSVDWGHFFSRPVLSPYEMYVMLGEAKMGSGTYEMDYYRDTEKWTNFGGDNAQRDYGCKESKEDCCGGGEGCST